MASSSYLMFLLHARVQLQLLSRQLRKKTQASLCHSYFLTNTHNLSCRLYSKTRIVCSAGSDSKGDNEAKFNDNREIKSEDQHFWNNQSHADPKFASEYFRQSWKKYSSSDVADAKSSQSMPQQTSARRKEIKQDAFDNMNNFGTLNAKSNKGKDVSEIPDMRNPNERIEEALPEDVDERRDRRLDIPLTTNGRIGKRAFYYTRKISRLGREGKIREAIDVFEYWIMVRDRVMPSKRTFVTLIGILGRVGYTDKAFELLGKMRQLGLDPEDHIYTSLFNACANCPSPTEGLRKAENLLFQMEQRGIKPNLFTVKAGMKAMAVCGNFPRAFALLDEAFNRFRLDDQCFDHLLMACISDKNAGFTRALQVWMKMVEYKITPSVYTFNMLIRSARDCGIGKPSMFASALGLNTGDILPEDITQKLDVLHDFRTKPKTLDSGLSNAPTRKPDQDDHFQSSDKERADSKNNEVAKQEVHAKSIDTVPLSVIDYDCSNTKGDDKRQSRSRQQNPPLVIHASDHYANNRDLDEVSGKECQDSIDKFSKFKEELNESLSHTNTTQGMKDGDGTRIYEWWEDEPSISPLSKSGESLPVSKSSVNKMQISQSKTHSVGRSDALDVVNSKEISLKDLRSPEGRLALIGGASKLLSYMEEQGIQPEVRTYAQILACLPQNEHSELELLSRMENTGVKPDIDLLNDIMMRRNMRHQSDTVKAILPIMSKERLVPNMRTYAALALTCHREKQAHELLEDMKEANLEPNAVIMGHLIYISRANYTYKLHMLETMESIGLRPTKENIAVIEKSVAGTKKKIIEAERNGDANNVYLSEGFRRSFQNFLKFYREWLVRTDLHKQRHPWSAFEHKKPEKEEDENLITAN